MPKEPKPKRPPSPLNLTKRMVAVMRRIRKHGDPMHEEQRSRGRTATKKAIEGLLARGLIVKTGEEGSRTFYGLNARGAELLKLAELGLQRREERQQREEQARKLYAGAGR